MNLATDLLNTLHGHDFSTSDVEHVIYYDHKNHAFCIGDFDAFLEMLKDVEVDTNEDVFMPGIYIIGDTWWLERYEDDAGAHWVRNDFPPSENLWEDDDEYIDIENIIDIEHPDIIINGYQSDEESENTGEEFDQPIIQTILSILMKLTHTDYTWVGEVDNSDINSIAIFYGNEKLELGYNAIDEIVDVTYDRDVPDITISKFLSGKTKQTLVTCLNTVGEELTNMNLASVILPDVTQWLTAKGK